MKYPWEFLSPVLTYKAFGDFVEDFANNDTTPMSIIDWAVHEGKISREEFLVYMGYITLLYAQSFWADEEIEYEFDTG